MGKTGLMSSADKLPIRRPAVTDEDTRIVGAERPRRLREPAAVFDRIRRRVGRREGPQPVRVATDLPAGFIGCDDWTAADVRAQRRIRRLRLARCPMDRVDKSPARDRQPETIVEQRRDPAEREPALFIEDDGQRHGLRPELHRRGAERIGGLQAMPALHAAATLRALADGHAKLVDNGPLHREIFLILGDDAALPDGTTAIRTVRGQRRLVRDIDARRPTPMRLTAIGAARLAPRSRRVLLGQASRERRRLARGAPARHFELFFQPLIFAPQPIALDLRAPHVLPEPLVFTPQFLNDLLRLTRRRIRRAPRHDMVMPDSHGQYKIKSGSAER